jgi:site-specific DNA-methyltransferase (adenine-specific)
MWVYGSGFPKSKNLDGEWEGWGTALKPAWEPIILARKPFDGTVAANVQQFGTGAINIDGCRVGTTKSTPGSMPKNRDGHGRFGKFAVHQGGAGQDPNVGRWPANVIHDGSDEVLAAFPVTTSVGHTPSIRGKGGISTSGHGGQEDIREQHHDTGSAARFFYCAKASKSDRGEDNNHPTVKPQALMRWLVRLVTPPGGMVLDPFMGSGTTGVAAVLEKFDFMGIEKEEEAFHISEKRIERVFSGGQREQLRAEIESEAAPPGSG